MKLSPQMKRRIRKGSLSGLALGIVVAIVALYIGLYMIQKVSDITNISATSDFYTTYTGLATNTGTIYDVLVLVIIIVALGVAIVSLRGFAKDSGGGGAAI